MVKAQSKGEFEGEKVLNEGEKAIMKPLEAKKTLTILKRSKRGQTTKIGYLKP